MTRVLKIISLVGATIVVLGVMFMLTGFVGGGAQYFIKGNKADLGTSVTKKIPLEAFKSITVYGNVMDVEFLPSNDGYGITFISNKNLPEPTYSLENGLLTVISNYPKHNNTPSWGISTYDAHIYYPADATFEEVRINLSVSDMNIRKLNAKIFSANPNVFDTEIEDSVFEKFSFKGNVGDVDIKRTKALEAEIDLTTGDFDGEMFDTKALSVNGTIGDIDMEGTMEGVTEINLTTGDVELKPTLPRDSYRVHTKSGMSEKQYGANGGNTIEVNTSMGEVEISFE